MSNKHNGMGRGHGPMSQRVIEKPKEFKKTGKRLMTYFKPYKLIFIVVFVAAILSVLFNAITPIFLGKITDSLYNSFSARSAVDFAYVNKMLVVLAVLFILASFFRYIFQRRMASISQEISYTMRKQMDEKIKRLPIKFFDSKTHGEILSRFVNDVDTVGNSLSQSMSQIINSVITIIGILTVMFFISPMLTGITLLTVPLSIFVTVLIAKQSQKHFTAQQRELGELNGHTEEMIGGQIIVKSFCHEDNSKQEFTEINDRLVKSSLLAQFISSIIMPSIKFVSNLGYIAIVLIGGFMVLKGNGIITVGVIQAFVIYSKQFNQPIVQTAQMAGILQSTVAAAERVFELLDEVEMPENGIQKIDSPKGEVKFSHVDFSYEPNEPLIEDLSLEAQPGQTIAIVGKTGAGKTTLVNLLMGFYRVSGGEITIDGVNINDLDKDNMYSMFGMVLQDTWLFNGSIYDNVAYGKEGATRDEVIEACKTAKAHGFIKRMPQGYDTMLNEEGTNVSAGQKQLLTIARALLRDPDILILDEATSSVDTRTEILIQKAMDALKKGRTSFIIAHRLSTIKNANVILVMDKGHIIEKGSHDELIAQKGYYCALYNSQFE